MHEKHDKHSQVGNREWQNFPRDEAKVGRPSASIHLLHTQKIHVTVSIASGVVGGKNQRQLG
jgi:hypothetical protein